MRSLDYVQAQELLESGFQRAESALLGAYCPRMGRSLEAACAAVFASNTQAYREVLLGCVVAKILDPGVDVRLPYASQGDAAFNARSLDEKVINPFLQARRVPCSKGPYLNVFRRSVRFHAETRHGLRDKEGYDALLAILSRLERMDRSRAAKFLQYLLYKFVQLRESHNVPLSRLQRFSLEQYGQLLSGLLSTPSGGRFPVLIAVAMLRSIKGHFGLDWDISYRGINEADAASGAGGDVTIVSQGSIILSVEITERPVDRSRVISTFNTKIAPNAIEDYLFLVGTAGQTDEAVAQAGQYFAQGHEVNFVDLREWVMMCLATTGKRGRETFNSEVLDLFDSCGLPQSLRVAWNSQVSSLLER